ncbi:hypothetical protein MKQ70_27670 [Chitinophaga sedimenti]|uniref:hypothetical protein n=1 Tax=Chitinophaga sedimenti TaxID=2033606 RepID=UPI002005C84F|nr:hypothetical protein [Chitinophaga sedimenti]MCK7558570.1 hypothetical protein [Chitinophaga sedimenti]
MEAPIPAATAANNHNEPAVEDTLSVTRRLGVVMNGNEPLYPYFKADLITGEANDEATEFVSLISKLDLTKYIDFYQFKEKIES